MADEIFADIHLPQRRYEMWHSFVIEVKTDGGRLLAKKEGKRPTSEWAASAARRISKRMVEAEKRRAKSNKDTHIREFRIGR